LSNEIQRSNGFWLLNSDHFLFSLLFQEEKGNIVFTGPNFNASDRGYGTPYLSQPRLYYSGSVVLHQNNTPQNLTIPVFRRMKTEAPNKNSK